MASQYIVVAQRYLFVMVIKSVVIQFAAAEIVMTLSGNAVTLSKEQAAIFLPLLPSLAETLVGSVPAQASQAKSQASTPSEMPLSDSAQYTNAKIFTRKKKNEHSTAVQNHLLVVYTWNVTASITATRVLV